MPKPFLRTDDELDSSLPILPSRTIIKLHNISVVPNFHRKIITKLNSPKVPDPDNILVYYRTLSPEPPHILAEVFNVCPKEP